jgi:hypothetical protein
VKRTAWLATLLCLSGCATGEVLGLVIGTALGWSTMATHRAVLRSDECHPSHHGKVKLARDCTSNCRNPRYARASMAQPLAHSRS